MGSLATPHSLTSPPDHRRTSGTGVEEQYPRLEMYGPAAKGREPHKGPVRVEATSVYLVQPLLR